MRKIIILIIATIHFSLFGQTNNGLQTIDGMTIYLDNSIIQKNENIQNVTKKEVYFIGEFKTENYTKPSPIEIEINNYKELKEKMISRDYRELNNTKAMYTISQNGNIFYIRSLKLLKIKTNGHIKFKAILYKIKIKNGCKNLIIIKKIFAV